MSACADVLRQCELNDLSRTAVNMKSGRSRIHRISFHSPQYVVYAVSTCGSVAEWLGRWTWVGGLV